MRKASKDMLEKEKIEGNVIDKNDDGDEMVALRLSKLTQLPCFLFISIW